MNNAVVIRHVPFEDLGTLGEVLAEQGWDVRYLEAGLDGLDQRLAQDADLLVILGGPIGVYEEDAYPFIATELAILEQRLRADRPTLGICLGSQLMARALGARVYPGGNGKEIGWAPIRLTEAGSASPLALLGPQHTHVLHWHGDTFELPEGAQLLAGSERYPHQAFSYGARSLALQFHPEVTRSGMERWFIGHCHEIAHTPGLSVPQLREDTRQFGERLEIQGWRFFETWLKQLDRG